MTGLGRGLSQGLSRWGAPRAVHDPGKIIEDLAAAVALGGDCERAWALVGDAAPGADGGLVTVDLDATIVIARPEKDQARPT